MGTYLVDELARNKYSVTASDITPLGEEYYKKCGIPYVHADISNEKDFDKFGNSEFDAVIHLAACQPANVSTKGYSPKTYIDVNVNGTLNVLQYCRKAKIHKIIYASSHRNTQGMWHKQSPIRESDGRAVKYTGEYAMFSISESAAQDCVEHFAAEYDIQSIIFRLPPVYGYGPHTEIFKGGKPIKTGFQVFIEQAIAGKPLEIWGDGTKGRDIVYVKDVVSAFVKAVESESARGLFNISSGRKLSLLEQAETIAKVCWQGSNKPAIISRTDKENDIESFVYDIGKANRELNWWPQFSFEDMLLDYLEETKKEKFAFLLEKRQMMFKDANLGHTSN
jgi:UDP-glucose 4-epimerase